MFLKNKNIIFKIRRSKVTDYAALKLNELPGLSWIRSAISIGSTLNYTDFSPDNLMFNLTRMRNGFGPYICVM